MLDTSGTVVAVHNNQFDPESHVVPRRQTEARSRLPREARPPHAYASSGKRLLERRLAPKQSCVVQSGVVPTLPSTLTT